MSGDPRVRLAYFVPPSQHFAGIERVVHEIATGLAEAHGDRLDVHVIFATAYDDESLRSPAYTRHLLGVDRLRRLAAALRACVGEHDIDVLVVPQVEATVVAWLATRGLRLPVLVSHLHGNPRIEEADGTRRTRAAFALFHRVVARRLAAVLTVSPSLQRFAETSLCPDTPVHFVKNPVRALDAPPARPPHDGPFRFVTVARLSHQKGQDILLRALAKARPDLPPVVLTLVGSGPAEVTLRRLSHELGLDDLVVFTGVVPHPQEHLAAADCFVLPSRWEGFGLVLIEALQFGLPLLAADCEFGPADVVTDRAIGDLVAPDDVEALADGLRRAVERTPDPQADELRRALARAYTREEATAAHYAVLRRILAEQPSRAGRLAAFVSA